MKAQNIANVTIVVLKVQIFYLHVKMANLESKVIGDNIKRNPNKNRECRGYNYLYFYSIMKKAIMGIVTEWAKIKRPLKRNKKALEDKYARRNKVAKGWIEQVSYYTNGGLEPNYYAQIFYYFLNIILSSK